MLHRILRRNYLLKLTFVSILGLVLMVDFILLVTFTCFILTPEDMHEIYSVINKGRIKTVLKRRSVFFTFLCACLALHTKVLSVKTARRL